MLLIIKTKNGFGKNGTRNFTLNNYYKKSIIDFYFDYLY